MMVLTRASLFVAAVTAVGLACLSAYVVRAAIPGGQAEPPNIRVAGKADQRAAGEGPVNGVDDRRARVHGVVVDETGKPVAGIEINGGGNDPRLAVTDELGRFDFRVPGPFLAGRFLLAGTPDRTRQGIYSYGPNLFEADTPQPIQIVLKPSRDVVVWVTDQAGVPVPGAAVEALAFYGAVAMTDDRGTAVLHIPVDADISRIIGLKSGRGFDDYQHGEPGRGDPAVQLPASIHLVLNGARTVQIRAVDSGGNPLAGISFSPSVVRKVGKRDGNVFTFQSEIAEAKRMSTDSPRLTGSHQRRIPLFFGPRSSDYHIAGLRDLQEDETGKILTARLMRDGTIRGHVLQPDGKPAAGIMVMTEEGRGRGYTLRFKDRPRLMAPTR